MPSYFVNNGIKQEIDDDLFDLMSSMLKGEQEQITSSEEEEEEKHTKGQWRRQANGYYNKKPNDEDYFKKYYKGKTKSSCICDVCGYNLSCKSNLSKHKKTKRCMSYLN